MKIVSKLFFYTIVFVCTNYFAQQEAQFSQYMYNTSVINAGYSGTRNLLSINTIHRSQWVGLEGAPTTQTLSIHSPIGNRLGSGINILRDEIGPLAETYANIDIAYSLPINEKINFSLGLKGGVYLFEFDFSKLSIFDPSDPRVENPAPNKLLPTVGVGGYFYATNWYLGLSTPNILQTQDYSSSNAARSFGEIHFYVIGGYVFNIHNNLAFKPASLVKIVQGAPTSIDLSANFLINKKVTLGASYRVGAAIGALAGFQLSDRLMLGYAYDSDVTDLRNYNFGSHEVFIRFEFVKRIEGNVSPRFF
jgi:type IX secretion system PorP/SprF family membrane protein